jgi:hypothetical protein
MIELILTAYKPLWGVMGIYNIRDLAAFMDKPSQMYQSIQTTVLEIEPQYPITPYRLPDGDYLASSTTNCLCVQISEGYDKSGSQQQYHGSCRQ